MLGRLAVASEDPDVPDRLSDWLRDALSPAGREKTPAVVQASLRSLGLASSGAMKPILDLFSREFAVINARQRHLKAGESLPEGARRRIALTTSQTLVNYGRERRLTQVHSRPFTKRSDVLYEGEMGPMDCPRLLYRYSAAGVSGRLELDGPRGHTAIRFRRGRIIAVSSTLPELSLKQWVVTAGLIDAHALTQSIKTHETAPDILLKAIVEQGVCGHHQVLERFESYSEKVIQTLVGESLDHYFFLTPATIPSDSVPGCNGYRSRRGHESRPGHHRPFPGAAR